MKEPKTLQEAVQFFSDPDNCLGYMMAMRWPDGPVCPTCGSTDLRFLANAKRWECKGKHTRKQFSIKIGTIMEDSAVPLDKWLMAMWMVANCKNGISSYELMRTIGVTQKSAWFMLHRIRYAMQDEGGGKLSGEVEVDETFIGGKARNMHKSKRGDRFAKRGVTGKVVVMGMLERSGNVKAKVIAERDRKTLHAHIVECIAEGSTIITDEWHAYRAVDEKFAHEVINHAEEYVRGNVHTNSMENFWSLLKRGLSGTYVAVEPFHLFRYIDEQAFRFNNRKDKSDFDRFSILAGKLAGKRLTYPQLTGKTGETQPSAAF